MKTKSETATRNLKIGFDYVCKNEEPLYNKKEEKFKNDEDTGGFIGSVGNKRSMPIIHKQHLSMSTFLKLPRWPTGKESTCQCRRCSRRGFDPWAGKIPWRRKWQLTPIFLPGRSHGQSSLEGYSPWGGKESDMTERLSTYAHTHTHTHTHTSS